MGDYKHPTFIGIAIKTCLKRIETIAIGQAVPAPVDGYSYKDLFKKD